MKHLVTFLSLYLSLFSHTIANAQETSKHIPVSTFAHLANARMVKVSPTGKYLSMLREIKGQTHIVVQGLDDKDLMRVVPPNEKFDLTWYEWVNEDWIIFAIRADSFLNGTPIVSTRLLSFDIANNKLQAIIRPSNRSGTGTRLAKYADPQIQDRVVDIIKDEPFHIMVSIDGDWDGESELRKVDIRDGKFKDEYPDKRGVQHWEFDHMGNLRMGWGYDVQTNVDTPRYFYFTPGTNNINSYENYQAYQNGMMPLAYTDDLHKVIMQQNYSDRTSRIIRYDMAADKIDEVLYDNENYSNDGIIYAPTTGSGINGRPIGYSYTKDMPEYVIWDKKWAKLYRTIDKIFPNKHNYIASAAENMRTLIILSSSDTDPGTYYYWNRDTKELSELLQVNPEITPEQLAPMQRHDYKARDGLDIPAYLTLPLGQKAEKLPLVVMPHGGPHARDMKSYDYFTQFLANRGYAVFQPNFRGSSGYAQSFESAGRRNWGLTMQDDVTDGVQALIDQGIADPKRICIIGASYGGYAALMGAIKTPDMFQCAASINGVTNLLSLINHDKKFIGGDYWTQSIGIRSEDSKQLTETSPARNADKIKIPILLIQFEDDRRVPLSQAEMMEEALEDADVPYVYKEYDHGGHSLITQEARLNVLTDLETFLAKHLDKS